MADWNDVPSGSMKPNILIGDRVFVNKLAYDLKIPFTTTHIASWGDPKRGDVAVFFSPEDGKRLVKRVIGLPGDRISMRNNHLLINGELASYEPLDAASKDGLPPGSTLFTETIEDRNYPVLFNPARPSMTNFPAITIPEGHYFMMGDNRDNSHDSRFFGPVPRQKVLGRAGSVIFSLDYDHWFLPRSDRFFRNLP